MKGSSNQAPHAPRFLTDQERDETIRACRFCSMCQAADRVAAVVRRESYSPRGRAAILFALENGLLEWDEAVADIMYTTLNDGLLRAWCVGGYDHEELVIDTRVRIFEKGAAPEGVYEFAEQLKGGPSTFATTDKLVEEGALSPRPGSEILLFCGCAARRLSSPIVSMAGLFRLAGVDFQLLSKEPCCGWPLYQLGDFEGARLLSVDLASQIRASGASRVVVRDADCYRMLATRTGRFGGDLKGIEILSAVELLDRWMEQGLIRIKERAASAVTYHDPCALARYCEELDAPRRILARILKEPLKEMETCGRWANCCGAGGMLSVHRPEIARQVSLFRLQEARETGAAVLVTGCLGCEVTLSDALQRQGEKGIQVTHIVEAVADAAQLPLRQG